MGKLGRDVYMKSVQRVSEPDKLSLSEGNNMMNLSVILSDELFEVGILRECGQSGHATQSPFQLEALPEVCPCSMLSLAATKNTTIFYRVRHIEKYWLDQVSARGHSRRR